VRPRRAGRSKEDNGPRRIENRWCRRKRRRAATAGEATVVVDAVRRARVAHGLEDDLRIPLPPPSAADGPARKGTTRRAHATRWGGVVATPRTVADPSPMAARTSSNAGMNGATSVPRWAATHPGISKGVTPSPHP